MTENLDLTSKASDYFTIIQSSKNYKFTMEGIVSEQTVYKDEMKFPDGSNGVKYTIWPVPTDTELSFGIRNMFNPKLTYELKINMNNY